MFSSLLIANRGEIACRIIRTARRMGLSTIAVYSEADADALHVRLADRAVFIGPAPAAQSYLNAEAIVAAAKASGAQAIHPGYGFLSERAVLPRLCERAGIAFVGPSADIIETMGSKIGAKAIASAAGVAGVPGYGGEDQSDARFAAEAEAIGYPIMVKASAGGGGKGMRRVFHADELPAALAIARQEASAAFGDPTLLVERLLLRPRHLEVQVAGDRHGHVVHLFERDCSVQRNNQKLLEEAPAPNLSPAVRDRLLSAGVAVARAVGYDNVGTVEFVLGEGEAEPWFLEMNTRLQVEHTVTEAITGEDLVEWQLRIAAGEPLPRVQDEIVAYGTAIEARVTAERAEHGFRPDAGTISCYREPAGVRVDSGVQSGSQIGLFYDSLLSKVVAFGETRQIACDRLAGALRAYRILGPATTLPFLIDAVSHPIFSAGAATTRFIDDAFEGGWTPRESLRGEASCVAATLATTLRPARARAAAGRDGASPWTQLTGFRLLSPAGARAEIAGRLSDADGSNLVEASVAILGATDFAVRLGSIEHRLHMTIDGDAFTVLIDGQRLTGTFHDNGERIDLELCGEGYGFRHARSVEAVGAGAAGGGAGDVLSPMPGVVSELRVAEGDAVAAGQVVAVLESMKLFVPVKAETAGIAGPPRRRTGETVAAGDLLLAIRPARDDETADAA